MCYSIRAHTLIGLVVLWSVAGFDAPVGAQDTGGPSQAAAAYEKGKGELRGGKLAEALSTFRGGLQAPETDQLETWQLLLGAALAAEKLDRDAHAIEYYRRFLDASEGAEKLLPPKWRERRQVVTDAVDELQRTLNATHGYLTVSSVPSSAALFVDGERAGVDGAAKTPFGLFLTPGTYEIRLERGGFEPTLSSVVIEVGKLKPLSVKMVEIVVAPPPPPTVIAPAPTVTAAAVEEESIGLGSVGWILVGGGGAVAIGGVIATIMGASTFEALKDTVDLDEYYGLKADLELYGTLSAVMYSLGAAAAVTGLILVLIDDDGEAEGEAAASFQLAPTPGGVYGQATLRF